MQIDFYFDYTSPFSYLAHSQLPGLTQWGARLVLKPIFLGGVVTTLGITPPVRQPGHARAAYMLKDLERWAELYGIPFVFNAHFPVNTLALLRATPYVEAQGLMSAWMQRCFHAVWGEGLDVADPAIVRQLAEEVGLSPDALWLAAQEPANKAWLKHETDAALARGVFGVPTFFIDDEMFFGNDRLLFVNRLLAFNAHNQEMARLRGE